MSILAGRHEHKKRAHILNRYDTADGALSVDLTTDEIGMLNLTIKFLHGTCRIIIGRGILKKCPTLAYSFVNGMTGRACIIADENALRYAQVIKRGLEKSGVKAFVLTLPSGERTKSLFFARKIYSFLARSKLDRWSPVFAVGGGTVGDVAGFCASTFMRGLPFFQIPSTFLAQIDASIGGKTAVNLPEGKNLVGTFYQPSAVFIDPTVLLTLSNGDFMTGMAEAIKYAMIKSRRLFAFLLENRERILSRDLDAVEKVIISCVKIKTDVVRKDERESGLRMVLNYGHTIGHAIEKCSGFRISHGRAISIGMDCAARIAVNMGIMKQSAFEKQRQLLRAFNLPVEMKSGMINDVVRSMRLDKKARAGAIRFVFVKDIGKPIYPVQVKRAVIVRTLKNSVDTVF